VNKALIKTIHKSGHFLDLGTSLLLGYTTAQSVQLFHHGYTGLASAIPYISTGTAGLLTFIASALTLITFDIKGGALGNIIAKNLSILNDDKLNKMYYEYKPKEVYNEEELKERTIFKNTALILLVADSLNLITKYAGEININMDIDKNALKVPFVQKYYLTQFVEKDSAILASLFLESLTCKPELKNKSYALEIMTQLLNYHPQLTNADQKLLTSFLKKGKMKFKNEESIHFFSQPENFQLFNQENQKLFLNTFPDKISNRNELIGLMNTSVHSKIDNAQSLNQDDGEPMKMEDKPIVINQLSYQNFAQFKINCETLFTNSSRLAPLLDKIEKVLLFKEKLLTFMAGNDNIKAQLFLTQDIDKTIHNFNREINILHKMKVMDHPDVEANKEKILSTMSSRIDTIIEKMSEQIMLIHQSLTDDLNLENEVNQKVLSSKM
jgi:hypothetical protein